MARLQFTLKRMDRLKKDIVFYNEIELSANLLQLLSRGVASSTVTQILGEITSQLATL